MSQLQISSDLALPLDFVTKTAAILAQRRKGKTYTAAVIAEELIHHTLPFVALDPTGAWWGLGADGAGPGLPVVVIGGQHQKLPLDEDNGRYLADLVLDHPNYYVIDLSLLGTKAAERKFAYAFADRLYRKKMQPGMDFPLHLFVDEADMFVPQERDTGDNLMLGAFQSIVRRGGLHGLGTTLISQRPALVNKNVLTQLDMLILLRLVAGNDQDYLDKNYVKRAGSPEQREELMGSLASLALGEAWVWEPGAEPPLFIRTQIRERQTFNSSATPKAGEQRVEPKRFAEVDLVAIKEAMAASIEKAKADDPRELRKRIAELERHRCPEPAAVEPIEIPVFGDHDRGVLQDIVDGLGSISQEIAPWRAIVEQLLQEHATQLQRTSAAQKSTTQTPVTDRPSGRETPIRRHPSRPAAPPTATPVAERRPAGEGSPPTNLPPRQQQILDCLGWFESVGLAPADRRQLGFFVGLSSRTGNFANLLSTMSTAGLIDYPKPGHIGLTSTGRQQVADISSRPASSAALQAAIFEKLQPRLRDVLRVLLDVHPDMISREDLGERLNLSHRTGNFANLLSKLRTLDLIDYPEQGYVAAADLLFLTGA